MPHLPDHQADHDPLLVAAYAAGDAQGEDLERARDLVATCDDCAALHHDLRAIAAAMPALPAPARRRDFRLTPEQAASLRPAGWRRLLAPLAGPRFAFAAPLGGSLAALGLAGVLVAGALSAPMAGTGGAGDSTRLAAPPAAATAGGPTTVVEMSAASGAPVAGAASQAAGLQPLPAPAASVVDLSNQGAAASSAAASSAPVANAVPDAAASADPAYRNPAYVDSGAGSVPGPKAVPASPGSATRAGGSTGTTSASLVPEPSPSPFLFLAAGLLVVGFALVAGRFVARRFA